MAPSRNQPAYDFFTGAPLSPAKPAATREPLRESFRQSQIAKPDIGNEELRAQLNTLQYELESLKQERELENLRHSQELRDAESKAEAEHRKAQEADSNKKITTTRYESLLRELQETQTTSTNEKASLEKKVRALQDQNQQLQEETEEAKSELQSLERQGKRKYDDLETRFSTVQGSVNDLQEDVTNKANALQITQQRLSQKEEECGKLESEVLQLKSQGGGSEELAIVRRELSEQVAHISKLEVVNREQLAELRKYQKNYKSVEIAEEEKRALENKLLAMNDLRRELGEVQLRKQVLEDERSAWASYLENEASSEGDLQFESPEQLARAFIQERLETASLLDKLGKIQPELAVREENLKTLEEEKANLTAELERLRNAGSTSTAAPASDNKARLRLERQRNLAVKEAEYLRAQLNAYGMDEGEEGEETDAQNKQRVQELEGLVEQYRSELQTVHKELSEAEKKQQQPQTPPPDPFTLSISPKKRTLDTDNDERVGELTRKNRSLQDDLKTLQKRATHLETDLKAAQSQITSLKSSSRTRILELRQNPTAQTEAIKRQTLINLRAENDALLARLQNQIDDLNSVPTSSLLRSQDQIKDLESTIADRDKRMLRLKQIWGAKANEFREAVASLMGYKMDFMPNGRVRVTSMFYPGDEETGENSIVFDGEKGEMKVSGGPKSAFAGEIRHMIDFWVDERKEIPCFLAAMTLEFYEKRMNAREQAAKAGKK